MRASIEYPMLRAVRVFRHIYRPLCYHYIIEHKKKYTSPNGIFPEINRITLTIIYLWIARKRQHKNPDVYKIRSQMEYEEYEENMKKI